MRRTFLCWSLLAALSASSATAGAEPAAAADCPDPEPTACGRFQFDAGTSAFERGDFTAAATRFRAALAERAHPVIRFNLALALARLGMPSAARLELEQVTKDPQTDKALRERAERERRAAEQAQAHVTLKLSDSSREQVELDGAVIDVSARPEVLLDPGPHHVRVISSGAVVLDQELELAPGERVELRVGERSRRIDVVVVPVPAAPAPAALPSPPPPPPAPAPGLSPAWLYGGLGVTAVLTGLTVWSGIDTQRAHSRYERDLPGLTQAQADARVDDGHARELRTNLLLTGSLLCGAGSAVLGIWFVDFSGNTPTTLALAPGRVALSGRF